MMIPNNSNIKTIAITENNIGKRLDHFMTVEIPSFSRSIVQKHIEASVIFVNDKPSKSNYKLRKNDEVSYDEVIIEENNTPFVLVPENIPLDIIYEDEYLFIVNKPKGMVVHPATSHTTGTLVNALLYYAGDHLSDLGDPLRRGIVHRLDKDTSGLLVVAKDNDTHLQLSEQLASRSVLRVYEAVVLNSMKDEEGIIDKSINRHPVDRKKITVLPESEGGREAITKYKVLEHLGMYTHVEATLITGRTHQIRVHFASIGNPVLGDLTYTRDSVRKRLPFKLICEGQVLHARTVGFVHPHTKKYMEFTSDLPDYFQDVLKKIHVIL